MSNQKEKKLTPPDRNQCQAEVPNGYSFMTLGGVPGRVRCKNKPTWLVIEASAGEDGQRGSMTVCDSCCVVLKKHRPDGLVYCDLKEKKADE